MKLFALFMFVAAGLAPLACKPQNMGDEATSATLSDNSSQKCGMLKQDQGKYLLFSRDPAGVEIAPQDGATTNALTALAGKEVCMIGNFYESPVKLTSSHFIQSKYQTLCGKVSKINDGYLFSIIEDPIDFQLLPQDGATTNILESKLGNNICLSADFRDQEVIIKSASQILPEKTTK